MLHKLPWIKDMTTGTMFQAHIARCWYVDEKTKEVHWRLTVSGNMDMVVDSQTCQDIFEGDLEGNNMMYPIEDTKNKLEKSDSYFIFAPLESTSIKSFSTQMTTIDQSNESTICVFCGVNSKQQRKDPKTITTYVGGCGLTRKLSKCNTPLLTHITCCKCKSVACITCIKSLCSLMETKGDHINDKWYSDVMEVLSSGTNDANIVGHCCEIKNNIKKESAKFNDETAFKSVLYDGYMHLPQIHTLIDSPINGFVDIHGLGKENTSSVPGLIHGIIGKKCARACHRLGVVPDGTSCKMGEDVVKFLEFEDIFGDKQRVTCLIHIVDIDKSVKSTHLRHNEVTPECIKHSKILTHPKCVDVWIILARTNTMAKDHQLVNMRWRSNLNLKKWSNSNQVESFYNDLLNQLSTDGLDAKRVGGSNGYTTYNNTNILKLLQTKDAFVRKGKAIKVVKKDTKWNCYYLKGGKGKEADGSSKIRTCREFTRYSYSQPQTSGNFEMNSYILDKYYDVIESMTIAKYNAPLIIKAINSLLDFDIQPGAVGAAIEDIELAKSLSHHEEDLKKKRILLVRLLSMDNLYTLVAYPCNYHFDVFKEGQYSLENKICFSFIPSGINEGQTGRGGAGPEQYTFALLDWTNSSKGRRRRQYIASGAQLKSNEVVTQAKWNKQFSKK